jgi:DNA-directed RNA polymerase specialized sigma24 family protein
LSHEDLIEIADKHSAAKTFSPGDRLDLEYAMNLLTIAKPECRDLLMQHYILGLDYGEIAEEQGVSYDNARMKIGRCVEEARKLVD